MEKFKKTKNRIVIWRAHVCINKCLPSFNSLSQTKFLKFAETLPSLGNFYISVGMEILWVEIIIFFFQYP